MPTQEHSLREAILNRAGPAGLVNLCYGGVYVDAAELVKAVDDIAIRHLLGDINPADKILALIVKKTFE